MSYNEQMTEIMSKYIAEHGNAPVTHRDVGSWAIAKGLWQPQPTDMLSKFSQDMSKALRLEHYTDPQGRSIRIWLSTTSRQEKFPFWFDMRTEKRENVEMAFQEMRLGILKDCIALETYCDSYNENLNDGEPIQLIFNFEMDLEEHKELV